MATRSAPGKLALSLLGLLASAGWLAVSLGGLFSDEPAPYDGLAMAMDGAPDAAGQSSPALKSAGPQRSVDRGDAKSPGAAGQATPSGGPDWARLFDRLVDREEALASASAAAAASASESAVTAASALGAQSKGLAEEGALVPAEPLPVVEVTAAAAAPVGPPELQVQGLLASDAGALALIDGHLLRVGDRLPGSPYTILSIGQGRVVVRCGDEGPGTDLLLAPLTDVDAQPSVATPQSPTPMKEASPALPSGAPGDG